SRPNLGRKTLNDTLDAVQDFVSELNDPKRATSFIELWRKQLGDLKPMHRLILSRRSGLSGPKETLEDIGDMLGITRERVRQIEQRVVERLQSKHSFTREVRAHLEEALGGARAVPLSLLTEEPWWAEVEQHERLLAFTLQRVVLDS